jgi:hypothetical protein
VPRNNFKKIDDYDSKNVQLENENNNNNNEDEETNNDIETMNENKSKNNEKATTQSGRVIELVNLLFKEEQEKLKHDNLIEMLCIGPGIGDGILHTRELHILNYKNAMAGDDCENW